MGTGKRTRRSPTADSSIGQGSACSKKTRKGSAAVRDVGRESQMQQGLAESTPDHILKDLLSTFEELGDRRTGSDEHQVKDSVVVEELYSEVARAVEVAFAHATDAEKPPRQHQTDAVAKLVSLLHLDQQAHQLRPFNYLVQHAAGTGKSLTISALALILLKLRSNATLAKSDNPRTDVKPLFSAVIIVTDRLQLDRQLGDTLESFLTSNGEMLQRCCSGSDLVEALTSSGHPGPIAILSTLQKFSAIAKHQRFQADGSPFRALLGRGRVAIVADEAHRSHGKGTSMTINEILGGRSGQPAGVNYFGFSATPSRASLRLFGVRRHTPTGTEYAPAHCYSMQQAIADGHVMNPLMDYRCLRPDLEIAKRGGERVAVSVTELRQLSGGAAVRGVGARLQSAARVVRFKSKLALQHFTEFVQSVQTEAADDSEAECGQRAMFVCKSRADVVAYTRELRRTAQRMGSGVTVYGAFSGELGTNGASMEGEGEEEDTCFGLAGESVSESSLNAGRATLDDAQILVVCNKLETGFDEPRLAVMFIDRPLSDARCVQVLSRCNRRCQGKSRTSVVDFVNAAEVVRAAFADFWGESTWGCGEAAVEARATEELDGCVRRLMGVLRTAVGEGHGEIGDLTARELAEKLGRRVQGLEKALHDLELYQELCMRLNSHKYELPPSFAAALHLELTESFTCEASPAQGLSERDCQEMMSRIAVGGVTETHKGVITVSAKGSGRGGGGIVKWDASNGLHTDNGKAMSLRQLAQQSALQRGADFKGTCDHVKELKAWIEELTQGGKADASSQGVGSDTGGLLVGLQRLDLLPMTREVLVETQVGVLVKGLRRHQDASVREMAKAIVARWKGLLRDTYPLTLSAEVLCHRHGGHLADSEGREMVVLKLRDALLVEDSERRAALETSTDGIEEAGGNKPQSEKNVREDVQNASTVARRVEKAVAEASVRLGRVGRGAQDQAGKRESGVGWYKQKVRQLLFNLRDKANGALRRRVLSQTLSAEDLVTVDAIELANGSVAAEKKKVWAEEARKVALEAKGSGVQPNTTEYGCPECGSRRCYVQFGMKGGWISSEKEGTKEVVCCDCLVSFDG